MEIFTRKSLNYFD